MQVSPAAESESTNEQLAAERELVREELVREVHSPLQEEERRASQVLLSTPAPPPEEPHSPLHSRSSSLSSVNEEVMLKRRQKESAARTRIAVWKPELASSAADAPDDLSILAQLLETPDLLRTDEQMAACCPPPAAAAAGEIELLEEPFSAVLVRVALASSAPLEAISCVGFRSLSACGWPKCSVGCLLMNVLVPVQTTISYTN